MKTDEIKTEAAYRSSSAISRAIRHGDAVYVSRQVPRDEHGTLVDGDLGEQTEQVLDNVASVLGAAGLTLVDVVKATVLLRDLDDFDAFNATSGSSPIPSRPAALSQLRISRSMPTWR